MIGLTDSLVDIVQILAYLVIALISIVIATYAISVSYLGREMHRSIWRKRKRREELERKVKELGEKADVTGIKEEIGSYEEEINKIDSNLFFLNIWGAVIIPNTSFFLSLVISLCIIYVNPIETLEIHPLLTSVSIRDFFTMIDVGLIALGSLLLTRTLFAIDWAASRISLPKFRSQFESGLNVKKIKVKELTKIDFLFTNIGDDVGEDIRIFINFPSVFGVKKGANYGIFKQHSATDYPNYVAAMFVEPDVWHMDISKSLSVIVTMPEKANIYTIPISFYERKTGKTKHELRLEVIE